MGHQGAGSQDMAVESGGNVEGSRPGEVVQNNGVKILGHLNLPGRVPVHASQAYSTNLTNLLEEFWDKESKQFVLRPFGQLGGLFRGLRRSFLEGTEKRALASHTVRDDTGSASERAIDLRKEAGAGFSETIASSTFDECFQDFAID